MPNLKWPAIIAAARDIIESYDTAVTLRQLFYRLVAAVLLPNTIGADKPTLGPHAEARRDGTFPDLIDNTRWIHEPYWYRDPAEALRELARNYRRNRTESQDVSIFLATEKRGLVEQLDGWFSDPYGIPVLPLGGWSSQSFIDTTSSPGWRWPAASTAPPPCCSTPGTSTPPGTASTASSPNAHPTAGTTSNASR
jgi:hypothetical protein